MGEHDFWAKVSLRDESAIAPLIVRVPGKKPAVCHSLVELLDLFPTIASICGLEVPSRLQGKDISPMLDDPGHRVREAAFSVAPSSKGFLLREDKWAYIQYAEDASEGVELFDMANDPQQFTNLAEKPEHAGGQSHRPDCLEICQSNHGCGPSLAERTNPVQCSRSAGRIRPDQSELLL